MSSNAFSCDSLSPFKLARWRRSRPPSRPTPKARSLTWARSWICNHNFSTCSTRKWTFYHSTTLPCPPTTCSGTSSSGTYARPFPRLWPPPRTCRRDPGPRPTWCTPAREPPQRRRGCRRATTCRQRNLHLRQLWQQPFVWWWKTPTLTLRWAPLPQRTQQWTLLKTPKNGQIAPSSARPHFVWMTRLSSLTVPPQVNAHICACVTRVDLVDICVNVCAFCRYYWSSYRWWGTPAPTSTNPWILWTGCGCRFVISA